MKLSHYRWAALALIAVVAALRLLYLAYWCPFDLAPDEAYYWEWSRRPDWSYHSKGPLVAWLIRLSCSVFGATALAVRLPAVVCGSLMLLGLFTLARRIYDERLALGVVGVALTLPIVAAGASLMTIDAPFTCAWMWALVFGHRAVFGEVHWSWLAAGLCIALGLLAKASMILWIPSFALFVLATPAMRGQLRRPGVWLMAGIGALGGVPILLWNVANGWVTFKHTQSHAGFEVDGSVHWLGPLRYLGAQLAILLGLWFVVWMLAMWRHRPTVETRPDLRFLWWMSAPTFCFFGLFALKNGGGEANWPIAAYLSGMVLAAGWLRQESEVWCQESGVRCQVSGVRSQESGIAGGWVRAGVLGFATLGLLVTLMLHEPLTLRPVLMRLTGPATPERPMPMRRVDPTVRMRGWRFLASEVDKVRADLRERGIEPILATERWTQASELAFYCDGNPTTHCLGIWLGDRDSQYDLWRPNPVADPESYRGRTFVLVGLGLEGVRDRFASCESVQTITYSENGEPIAEWTLTVAHGFGSPP